MGMGEWGKGDGGMGKRGWGKGNRDEDGEMAE